MRMFIQMQGEYGKFGIWRRSVCLLCTWWRNAGWRTKDEFLSSSWWQNRIHFTLKRSDLRVFGIKKVLASLPIPPLTRGIKTPPSTSPTLWLYSLFLADWGVLGTITGCIGMKHPNIKKGILWCHPEPSCLYVKVSFCTGVCRSAKELFTWQRL